MILSKYRIPNMDRTDYINIVKDITEVFCLNIHNKYCRPQTIRYRLEKYNLDELYIDDKNNLPIQNYVEECLEYIKNHPI